MENRRPRHNWRSAYHESFVVFRDQYRQWRRTNMQRRVWTRDGEFKRVVELSDSEIEAIAWFEAEQSANAAIHQHNANLSVMKSRAGEAQ